MPYVETSVIIDGDIDAVYNFAKDMESYPKYMPDVESVKILDKTGNKTLTDWVTSVEGTPIMWKEEDIFDDENKTITYALTEGDLDKFEGQWVFSKTEDGKTEVILGVDYDFGIPSLTELIGPTLDLKVKENSAMMLKAMKKEIEAEAGCRSSQ